MFAVVDLASWRHPRHQCLFHLAIPASQNHAHDTPCREPNADEQHETGPRAKTTKERTKRENVEKEEKKKSIGERRGTVRENKK